MAQFRPLVDAVRVAVFAPLGPQPGGTVLVVSLGDATTAKVLSELGEAGFVASPATVGNAVRLAEHYTDLRAIVLVGNRDTIGQDELESLLDHARQRQISVFDVVGDTVRYGDPAKPVQLQLRRRRAVEA
jgi:hypothetical protein